MNFSAIFLKTFNITPICNWMFEIRPRAKLTHTQIVRNVWGKVIKDSNPSFWLPTDYRASIPDPLTDLDHFPDGRVYECIDRPMVDAQIGYIRTGHYQYGTSISL
ncbi:Teneurin-2 [Blomia tropicalis]|nr:Teneurin-2 [Blomia tropicalis]